LPPGAGGLERGGLQELCGEQRLSALKQTRKGWVSWFLMFLAMDTGDNLEIYYHNMEMK
jgi:hypothetical protein